MATILGQEPLAGEENRLLYGFLLGLCALLLNAPTLLTIFEVKSAEKIVLWYQHTHTVARPVFVGFQRRFLSVFVLFTFAEGLQGVYGEALYENLHKFEAREIGFLLVTVQASSLIVGTFLGAAADSIGRKKACIIAGLFQFAACCLDGLCNDFYGVWLANVCRGIGISVFPSAFEAWLTSEHERLGFKQDWLSRTFWVMAFGMGVAAVTAGVWANFLVYRLGFGLASPFLSAAAVSFLWIVLLCTGWTENASSCSSNVSISTDIPQAYGVWQAFVNAGHAITDKRVLLLGWTQACFDLSLAIFWLLWTPTMVSDGREIHSGVLYSYFMGSLMLGSVIASIILCGPFPVRPEIFLPWVFLAASLSMVVPGYDYQEIQVLVAAFCVFHICVGIAWPSLARLRNIYILSDRRAAVLSLYRVPGTVGVVLILIKGALMKQFYNSTIYYICAFGLLSGAGTLHLLNIRRPKRRDRLVTEDTLPELRRHH
ncbi:unnamed protein product [Calypogeia fissa]